jgi:beta-glucosidase
VTPSGAIDDKERAEYQEWHIAACVRAAVRGVPVTGYFVWSLLDNFEWSYGYDKRFGLIYVDYRTQERTIKGSGYRYADLIRAHRRRSGESAA